MGGNSAGVVIGNEAVWDRLSNPQHDLVSRLLGRQGLGWWELYIGLSDVEKSGFLVRYLIRLLLTSIKLNGLW